MKCNNCGMENNDGVPYCQNCGAPLENASMNYQNPQTVYVQAPQQDIPAEYQPISMWGYFGYEILFSIPCIGLILLLVFSFGGTKNVNLKNFARSYFCFMIILAVIVLIVLAITGGSALSAFN